MSRTFPVKGKRSKAVLLYPQLDADRRKAISPSYLPALLNHVGSSSSIMSYARSVSCTDRPVRSFKVVVKILLCRSPTSRIPSMSGISPVSLHLPISAVVAILRMRMRGVRISVMRYREAGWMNGWSSQLRLPPGFSAWRVPNPRASGKDRLCRTRAEARGRDSSY